MAEENRNAGYDGTEEKTKTIDGIEITTAKKTGKTGIGVNGNLIPANMRTPEERRALSAKGGQIAAEKARKKRDFKEAVRVLLETDVPLSEIKEELGEYAKMLEGDSSAMSVMAVSMIKQAIMGNHKAFETARDTAGYKPKDEISIEAPMTDADREMLERVSKRLETGLHNDSKQAL